MSVPKLPPIAARDLARKLYPEDPDLMVSLLSEPYFVIDDITLHRHLSEPYFAMKMHLPLRVFPLTITVSLYFLHV